MNLPIWRTTKQTSKETRPIADTRCMKTYAASLVCLLAFMSLARSAPAQDVDEAAARSKILALEHAWNQAEAFNDLKALDALFDSNLVYVDSDGKLMNKAEFLSHVKASHLQQVITQSMNVQVFNDTAIATGTYLAKEFKEGKQISHYGRFVDAWVRRDQTWVCVSAQATPILR
jgi:ketosteroid isomerase-like protein